jgi:MFS family permease
MRCLRSAGASSSIAIAYSIIADIAIPAERGSYVGVLMGAINAAPSFGPVIGGILAENLSWRWIFWLLVIVSGTLLAILTIFLPETAGSIVGDGSVWPPRLVNRSIYPLKHGCQSAAPAAIPSTGCQSTLLGPFKALSALWDQANFIVILAGGTLTPYMGALLPRSQQQSFNTIA